MEELDTACIHVVNRFNHGVLVVGNVTVYIVCGDVWFVRTNHVVGEIVHIGLRSTQLTHVHGIGIVHAIAHVGNGVTTVVQAVAC